MTIKFESSIQDKSINHPDHYAKGRVIEPIHVIEDWNLPYNLGCVLKYISRAGRKTNIIEDLKKAIWYLERHYYKTIKGEDTTCHQTKITEFI